MSEMPECLKVLRKDKRLKMVLAAQEPVTIRRRRNVCLRLCASIMSQQLSTRVAEVIFKRFLSLFEHTNPSPEEILQLSATQLRSIGLSNAKAAYVLNVARFASENGMSTARLSKMSNEEVIEYLTAIKGVGRWTVEMLLMFTLGREDVFAVDDLGIQQAIAKVYGLEELSKKELKQQMLILSENWQPYRTYACMHLWRWKDFPKQT